MACWHEDESYQQNSVPRPRYASSRSRVVATTRTQKPMSASQPTAPLNSAVPGAFVDMLSPRPQSCHPDIGVGRQLAPVSMAGDARSEASSHDTMFAGAVISPSVSLDDISFPASSSFPVPPCNVTTCCASVDHISATNQQRDIDQITSMNGHGFTDLEGEDRHCYGRQSTSERPQSDLALFSVRSGENSVLSRLGTTDGKSIPFPEFNSSMLPSIEGARFQRTETASVSSSEKSRVTMPASTAGQRRQHSTNGERRYRCCICDRPFDKKYNLQEHLKRHDPNRASQFACPAPGCTQKLGRKTDVSRHFQSVHEKAKKFACSKCYKRFDRKDTLSRHRDREGGCPYSKQLEGMMFNETPQLAPSEWTVEAFQVHSLSQSASVSQPTSTQDLEAFPTLPRS